jgi:hypothetical protein
MKRALWVLPLILLAGLKSVAQATPIPIVDFTGGTVGLEGAPLGATRGFAFAVTSPLVISALGAWDEGANGLGEAHTVSLWTNAGELIASTIVNNSSTPIGSTNSGGDWRFTNIAPLPLGAGTYVVGETNSPGSPDPLREPGIGLPVIISTIPGVTYVENRHAFAPDTFPTLTVADVDFFGPSLLTDAAPAAVPEPATVTLLGLGLASAGARRLRDRR